MTTFDRDILDLLSAARTVRIETTAGEERPVHRTAIWIVVDDADRVLVRSVRGRRGRWYRELVANPNGAVHVGDRRIPVRAAAVDRDGIESCSTALRAKYRGSGASLQSMLPDEILDTTLELGPV